MSLLLERQAELEALQAAVVEAASGRGSVVAIAGVAGIGKSSLVARWAEDVGDDARVLVGLCDDFLTSRTLGPLHDVARGTGGSLADAVARADTSAVFDAVLAEVNHPLHVTVMVLEDVHWADEATLDVIRYVGRRIASLRGVLVLTYRDDEVGLDHPLTRVLGVLPSTTVRWLHPEPLSAAAVRMLTAGVDVDPEELLRVTGGNPFFVSELARQPGGVPRSVVASITSRLQSLPEGIRTALEMLSVMPRPARLSLLVALVPDAELLAAGDARGLWTMDQDRVQFRHELTRQAIRGSLLETTRHRHHEAILTELLRSEPDAAAVLHHAVMVNRGEVVVQYGVPAAQEAFQAGAHREAAQHQQHVLQYRHLMDSATCAQLLEEHAWSLLHLHRFPLAVEAAKEAVSLLHLEGSPSAHARALCTLSRMRYLHNEPAAALATAEDAVSVAAQVEDLEVRTEARLARASLLSLLDRRTEARGETAAVLAAARDLGRTDLESLALNYLATCGPAEGEPADLTIERFIQAVTVARKGGHLEAAARAYTNLISQLVWGYHPDVDRWYDEAIAFTSDHDFPSFRYSIIGQGCRHLIGQGRWEEAEAALRELLDAVEGVGVLEIVALEGLARILVRRGSPDAESVVARAWQLAVESSAAQYTGPVGAIRAELSYLQGNAEAAARIGGDVPMDELEPFTRGELLVYLARAGAEPVEPSGEVAAPWSTVLAGDHATAADQWAAIGNPYERALSLLATGQEASLLEAVDILDRLEAAPAARLVRRRLRDLGVRAIPRGPTATTRSNPAGLTQRQLEVLGLIADGLTNAQIAEHLVVSVRTVDHHVSAILQKLGVSSRREAASAVSRDDRAG